MKKGIWISSIVVLLMAGALVFWKIYLKKTGIATDGEYPKCGGKISPYCKDIGTSRSIHISPGLYRVFEGSSYTIFDGILKDKNGGILVDFGPEFRDTQCPPLSGGSTSVRQYFDDNHLVVLFSCKPFYQLSYGIPPPYGITHIALVNISDKKVVGWNMSTFLESEPRKNYTLSLPIDERHVLAIEYSPEVQFQTKRDVFFGLYNLSTDSFIRLEELPRGLYYQDINSIKKKEDGKSALVSTSQSSSFVVDLETFKISDVKINPKLQY